MRKSGSQRHQATVFWGQLPRRGKVFLLLAIFLTFSTVGIMQDVMTATRLRPVPVVVIQAIFGGLAAVGYAFASMRDIRFMPLVFLFQIAAALGISRIVRTFWSGSAPSGAASIAAIQSRLNWDGLAAVVLVALGYTFFIITIVREGGRFARLRAEVDLSAEVQRRLVPRLHQEDARAECFGVSIPSSTVGGDLVDALPHHDGTVAYVADVAGHGIPAGTLMGMVKTAARMSLGNSRDLGEAVTAMHRALFHLREPERFITFAAVRFERPGEAEVAIAGHLPILHVRAGGDVRRIENQHLPIGVDEAHTYTSRRVPCAPGDLFVIVSDGLTEVADGRGSQLGIEPLEAIVREHSGRPLAEISDRLFDAVRGHGPQDDDQTLLLMRAR